MKRSLRAQGFTLIEILVVIVIVGILLALGVPSFQDSIERNAVTSHANTFMNSLRYARSEAIRSGLTVAMCRSINAESGNPSCSAGGGGTVGWATGWVIFVDRNNNGVINNGETILRVQGPVSNSGGIVNASGSVVYTFRPTGVMVSAAASETTFNSRSGNTRAERRVCVGFTGRARLITNLGESC